MKKFIISVLILFSVSNIFAQNSAVSANRNTALRCLSLAENCLVSGDWNNALKQAELGLSYDESISDLLYIKAAAKSNLGETKAEILPVIEKAFEIQNWVNYSTNGARILLADLLCDIGKYNESLFILDQEPLIFSADAEFIRIKDFYRIGTPESLNNARLKVNSARRIYPMDERFPSIFFVFESLFKMKADTDGIEYEIPETVRLIADSYIAKLPDYSGKNDELEIYASFIAQDEIKERLIKSISAKSKSKNPLLVLIQMQIGMISDEDAFANFLKSIDNTVNLDVLECFLSYITDEEVKQQIVEYFTNFNGVILIDENLDLQNELAVKYDLGRPSYLEYDSNNDGKKEFIVSCDYGAPVTIDYTDENAKVVFDLYPDVEQISFKQDNLTFSFYDGSLSFIPYDILLNNSFEKIGLDFYVPEINSEVYVPSPSELITAASSIEMDIEERQNAKISYTTLDGDIVFAEFYEGEKKYAYCDFSVGIPFVRYVDYDNDDYFETSEIFNIAPVNYSYNDSAFIEKIFNKLIDSNDVYLSKIQIDRNSNTFIEFAEEYLPDGTVISTWDYDDNGLPDGQFIKYKASESEPQIEEAIFYDSNGIEIVSLYSIDSVPMKMNYGEEEVIIYSGDNDHIYWIDKKADERVEEAVMEYTANGINQGVIDMIEYEDSRYTIIRIGKDIFCKEVPVIEE